MDKFTESIINRNEFDIKECKRIIKKHKEAIKLKQQILYGLREQNRELKESEVDNFLRKREIEINAKRSAKK